MTAKPRGPRPDLDGNLQTALKRIVVGLESVDAGMEMFEADPSRATEGNLSVIRSQVLGLLARLDCEISEMGD